MALAACGSERRGRNIIDDSGVASGDTATDAGDTSEAPYRILLVVAPVPEPAPRRSRNVSTTLRGLFEALLQGPTESDHAMPGSARRSRPTSNWSRPRRRRGMFVYLDVNDALYSLSGSTLVDALAQIVFTMVELPEVSVQRSSTASRRMADGGRLALTASELTPFDFRAQSVGPARLSEPAAAAAQSRPDLRSDQPKNTLGDDPRYRLMSRVRVSPTVSVIGARWILVERSTTMSPQASSWTASIAAGRLSGCSAPGRTPLAMPRWTLADLDDPRLEDPGPLLEAPAR
ncbi:MAG: GerMN domain-containing protein [Ilumatobacteraceae bacterium]